MAEAMNIATYSSSQILRKMSHSLVKKDCEQKY